MAYHPLLDWRLADDMLRLLAGEGLDTERTAIRERHMAASYADSFGGTPLQLDGGVSAIELGGRLIIITHPLESHQVEESTTERLGEAIADAEDQGFGALGSGIMLEDTFTMLRTPGRIASRYLALT